MDKKQISKGIARYLARIGLNTCSFLVKLIPERFIYGFANSVAHLGFAIATKQRKIALESLSLAFAKEKTDEEIKKIAKESFELMSKSAVELMFMMDKPLLIKERINLVNKEYLDEALSRKKGVILVSAHFGNFPLLLARLSQEGYKTGGIMRPMRDPKVEKMFFEKRMKYGVKTIYSQPRNVCVDQTIKALRENEIVFIPIDQNFGTSGVFVDFFGQKAATATGPVIFAQRTKACMLPCFIVRQADNTHKIFFEPAMDIIEGESQEETVHINIQKLTSIIELYIRKYPAEWGWIHRRWKTKPKEEA